jgi:hypothetical protein
MQLPYGYYIHDGMVYRLCCSLYGLKQTSYTWFERFAYVVNVVGFSPIVHDHTLCVYLSASIQTLLILLYVDDIIITLATILSTLPFSKRVSMSNLVYMSDLDPLLVSSA